MKKWIDWNYRHSQWRIFILSNFGKLRYCKTHRTITPWWRRCCPILIVFLMMASIAYADTIELKINGSTVYQGTCGAVTPIPCVFTYSAWSTCQNGTQSRTVISSTPINCTGIPVLTQSCQQGQLGTKTNPIPMNQVGGRGTTYFPSVGNIVPLRANEKKWFVVDSLATTGRSVTLFIFNFKTYNNSDLVYTKVPQNKTGQDLGPEVRILGLEPSDTVNNNQPYNLNDIKYLYAIQNNGPATMPSVHPELSVYFNIP